MPFTGKYIHGNSLIHQFNAQGKIIVFIILIFTTVFTDSFFGYILLVAILGMKTYIFFHKIYMEIFYCYFYFKCFVF